MAVAPLRVVSLLPSATELVCLVGAGPEGAAARLVGRSHECDYPAGVASVAALTAARNAFVSMSQMHDAVNEALGDAQQLGLYTIDAPRLRALRPDVIVTQSLCEVCSVDLRLVEAAVAALWAPAGGSGGGGANGGNGGGGANGGNGGADGGGGPPPAKGERPPRVVCLNPFTLGEVLDDATRIAGVLAEELELRRGGSGSAADGDGDGDGDGGSSDAGPQRLAVKRLADGLRADAAAAVAALWARVAAAVAHVPAGLAAAERPSVAFLEWFEPIFPGGHWTPQLIHLAGGSHPLNPPAIAAPAAAPASNGAPADPAAAAAAAVAAVGGAPPSRAVFNTELQRLDPRFVVVCCCGLDIAETLAQLPALTTRAFWRRLSAVQGRECVAVVDGNQMFNRPGPRLVDCLEWLVGLLQGRPELMPAGFPWRWLAADDPHLAAGEAAWLREHQGWPDSVQKGPPQAAAAAAGAGAGADGGCSTGRCGAPAQAPAAACE